MAIWKGSTLSKFLSCPNKCLLCLYQKKKKIKEKYINTHTYAHTHTIKDTMLIILSEIWGEYKFGSLTSPQKEIRLNTVNKTNEQKSLKRNFCESLYGVCYCLLLGSTYILFSTQIKWGNFDLEEKKKTQQMLILQWSMAYKHIFISSC